MEDKVYPGENEPLPGSTIPHVGVLNSVREVKLAEREKGIKQAATHLFSLLLTVVVTLLAVLS